MTASRRAVIAAAEREFALAPRPLLAERRDAGPVRGRAVRCALGLSELRRPPLRAAPLRRDRAPAQSPAARARARAGPVGGAEGRRRARRAVRDGRAGR